jgi:membrane protease YdiL (CAAX protease family)
VIGWIDWLPHGWWTLPFAVGLLLLVVAYFGYGPPAILKKKTGKPIPEASFLGYDATDIEKYVQAAGGTYRAQLWWDMLFALAYGAGLIAVVDGTFGWAVTPPGRLAGLIFIPVAATAADLLEDALLLIAIPREPAADWRAPKGLLIVARGVTILKWALVDASVLLIVAGAVALAFGGPHAWPAQDFMPLVLASLVLILFHLGLTLLLKHKATGDHVETFHEGLWIEVISTGIRFVAAMLILFFGASWFFHFFHPFPPITSVSKVATTIGIDLTHGWLWRLVRWGVPFAAGIVVAYLIAYRAASAAGNKASDPRFAEMSFGDVALKIVLILLGTVVLEELVFRGVLLSAWDFNHEAVFAVLGSSVVFGLWHIGPALRDEQRRRSLALGEAAQEADETSSIIKDRQRSSVFGTVAAMIAAGVLLCMLRIWSRGIWSPALVHLTANGGGVVFSWRSAQKAKASARRETELAELPAR